jgi:hypothetical protein
MTFKSCLASAAFAVGVRGATAASSTTSLYYSAVERFDLTTFGPNVFIGFTGVRVANANRLVVRAVGGHKTQQVVRISNCNAHIVSRVCS